MGRGVAYPELVHLPEVEHDEVDGVLDGAALALVGRVDVGELILAHLREVIAEEQAAHRVLDALTHLDEVLQDVLARRLLGLDEDPADGDQEVPITGDQQ